MQRIHILWRNRIVNIISKVIAINLMVLMSDVYADSARHRHHHRNSNNDDRDTSITCPFKVPIEAFTINRKALKYPYANGTSVLDAYSGRWRNFTRAQ